MSINSDSYNIQYNPSYVGKSLPPQDEAGAPQNKISAVHIKDLESLYYKETKNSILDKFISKCGNALFKISSIFNPRSLESYRTQEHLIRGFGSHLTAQSDAFKKHFGKKTGGNFDKLNAELKNGFPANSVATAQRKILPGGEKLWAEAIKSKLKDLEAGQSLWVDATTLKGYHGMIMRLTKNQDDSFDLQYANTGAGMETNPDFHPKQSIDLSDPQRANNYQLVGLMKSIPADKLMGDFFETFAHISETGKAPKGSSFKEAYESKTNEFIKKADSEEENRVEFTEVINQMYCALRCLGTPEKTDDARYYSTQQIGNSCVASSMWAMAKVVLTPQEFQETQRDMQIQSLVHHYKQLKEGYDQSTTRKIMVLDLIQVLKKEYDDPMLGKIEKEIKGELNMLDAEVKISKASNVKIESLIKENQGKYELPSFDARISTRMPSLVNLNLSAHVAVEETEEGFSYQLEKRPGTEQWKGKSMVDKTGLLSFYVANGNHQETKVHLEEILKDINNPLLGIKSSSGLSAVRLLGRLAENFEQFDTTRSGIAKRKCLALLAIKQLLVIDNVKGTDLSVFDKYNESDKDDIDKVDLSFIYKHNENDKDHKDNWNQIKSYRARLRPEDRPIFDNLLAIYERTNEQYRDLKVNKYLSEDNIWQKAINQLQGINTPAAPPNVSKQPALSLESKIASEPVTEGKTCAASKSVLTGK